MRTFAEAEDLSAVVRAALGGGVGVTGVDRLRGGSKKGVYRVGLDGGGESSVIVYRWSREENFWPDGVPDHPSDPFAPASGLVPFVTARRTLDRVGARVPRVLLADDSGRYGGSDVAVVEDVAGGTLESLFGTEPDRAEAALADLARTLDLMRRQRAPRYGRVDLLERGGSAIGDSCEQVVLDRALRDLAESAAREPAIAAARGRIADRLRESAALVPPRAEYGLVHGELGPDHVLVDPDGRAVLIDIEGLMYFDVEWEHVFLRLRFHDRYGPLARPGLDRRRLDLYRLAMRLSLVAGPLRLLDGDYPDREFMLGIVAHNLREALSLVGGDAG